MKTSRNLLLSFISLSLLLSVATSPALGVQRSESVSEKDAQFPLVEQPLLRIGMTLGGFAVIGILISSAIEVSEGESVTCNQGTSLDRQPV